VQTEAGPTRTMAPRPKETLEELPLPEVSADWTDFYRNFLAALDKKAELIVKHEEVRRVLQVMVAIFKSHETGEAVAYGLYNAQERGALFIAPGARVYAGMVVGQAAKGEDMTVNVCKRKQLTNIRASGSDDALRLTPPRRMSLEQCLEFLADDELLEVTPQSLRLRKRELSHEQRMKRLKKG